MTISANRSQKLEPVLWYGLLIMAAILTVLPFVWLLSTSLKNPNEPIATTPPRFIPLEPTFDNYIKVWNYLPIWRYFLNSVFVSVCVVIGTLIVTSLAAYPLAKMRFKGRDIIFYALLATLLVPSELTLIPSYVMMVRTFELKNNFLSLILPNIAGAFDIFLLRQAMRSVPDDLLEAARIDGASEIRIWWQVLLPVVRPALATVAIFSLVGAWNAFLWPSLMLTDRSMWTLTVGLARLSGLFFSDFRALCAGTVMTILPILLFFSVMQRNFVGGLAGAVKG